MKVGLFFDLRNPTQWRQDPARLHAFTLELIEEAEHLGIDSVWASEHHLFVDDYLTSPLTFLAAAAARTKRVRLGTAIIVAPIHHHAEIAEQAVLVDLISNGRVDLGLGAGYRIPEYDLFDASIEKRYTQTDETARQVRRHLSPGGVKPQPVQNRVPIWMGYQGPQGAHRAGCLGEGLLTADARCWEPYREGLVAAGHDASSGRMAGSINAFVTDDPEKDWELVRDRLAHQLDTYNMHALEGSDLPTPRAVDPERIRTNSAKRQNYFWCDTAQNVAAKVRDYTAGAPVESVHLFVSLSGMPEDVVVRHMQSIANELRPALADLDAASEAPALPPDVPDSRGAATTTPTKESE